MKICDTSGSAGEIPVESQVANAAFIVLAANAHDKLLEAVKMVFEAADEASSQELGQNIDWDMLRDAYNIGLKGEA